MNEMARGSENGFTLSEVLIGTAVLGLAIATFLISTRHALALVDQSDAELRAVREAENMLALGGATRGEARLSRIPSPEEVPGLAVFRVEPGGSLTWYVELSLEP